ncbi:toll-like receptor Tollo [Parasteatoda tepidariorum]|uniref:Toll family protein LongTollA n=2 Tax=Parasteatoda tepidariorum TaxID=114398 RepID=A0A173ADU9_PARTP|nr:toll-like receptor Tollo [Parasteatoda tepidariorum]ANG08898.1 toll family protein LongTollA [Parasteatoda tepidariorum]
MLLDVRKKYFLEYFPMLVMLRLWCLSFAISVVWCSSTANHGYVAPEDCEWTAAGSFGSASVSLTCVVRTINGAFDSTNFSLIQPQNTVSLKVKCENVLFESALANNSFHHLKELRSLHIEFCKLKEIPLKAFWGLNELTNLTVRTYNSEWGEIFLKIIPGSLSSLQKLTRLDLSRNNMPTMTPSLLCSLPNLQHLNLSFNDFSEVVNLGFAATNRTPCPVFVQNLDLSNNRLKVLSDYGFTALRHLRTLHLQANRISRAEETALSGLGKLQILDISNNLLVALPPGFFKNSELLSELYLQNNSMSVLPPGLFSGLQQMLVLDLSHNLLTSQWLNADIFADMTRLVVLDLSYNKLSHLESATFRSQYSLQVLQLHHNELVSIADHAFSSLYNLQTLVLTHNNLTYIDAFTFTGLQMLSMLSLDFNSIQAIHSEALKNCSNLHELNLNVNKLIEVPKTLKFLQQLRALDISNNRISVISNASYQGLRHLYSLRLAGNSIGNLTKGVFEDLPSIRILNLANNNVQSIEQGTFDEVPELHALNLDSNMISDINSLFINLHDLLMLNISANRISWFDYALIPIGLQWLDVHANQIETLGNYYELESLLKLRTLDASFNKITEIEATSLPNSIEILFLNNNFIKTIQPFTFLGKQNLTRVELKSNYLETLEMNAFRLSEVPNRRPLPEFTVSDNPYICDCNMEWLQRMATLDESRQYPRMTDIEEIQCSLTFKRRKSVVPLTRAQSSQFLCSYKSHCFALCHCCEFDACDCEMVCPENCTCYYDQSWNTNIVDCGSRRLTSVPRKIPMDVTELYLDGSDISTLSSHTFIGRKNMKILYLNNSNVHTIDNRTFNGLRDLLVLNLAYNRLTTLHGYEFERLSHLQELYLSHNMIATISNVTFAALKSIEILHLDHNYIVHFQVWLLNANPRLQEIKLAHNSWTCDCFFVGELKEFLNLKGDFVRDMYDLECHYNHSSSHYMLDFNTTACSNFTSLPIRAEFDFKEMLPVFIVVSSVIFVVIFIVILIFVFRKEMGVWFYAKYGVRLFQAGKGRTSQRGGGDEDKLFDAFVSYSKKDEAFVTQILAPELECGMPNYRLCLHYRDLPVSGYIMSEAIMEAMESSRRTILILSENFLKSEWCRFEFKSAHREVLSACQHRLLVIELGKVDPQELDPDIRLWLRQCPVVRWGEKQFWDRLKYAMPDVRHRKTERNRNDVSVAVHI